MEKLKHILSNLLTIAKSPTVELPIFFGLGSQIISHGLFQDLSLYQGCKVDLNYTDEICNAVSQSKGNISGGSSELENAEAEVHELLSNINSSFAILEYGLPIFIIFFLGPLSDICGRKIPMIVAFTGLLLQAVGFLVASTCSSWSVWILKLLIVLPRALCGGEVLYGMASIAYISDITPNDMTLRTIRINIYTGVYIASTPFGSLLAGQISTLDIEYFYRFMISGSFMVIGAIFLLILVPNTRSLNQSQKTSKEILTLIFAQSWSKNWKTLLRSRKGYVRLKILCLLFSHFCIVAPQNAEYNVRYLFTKIQLDWSLLEYGNFSAISTVFFIVGIMFTSGILAYSLKLSDPIIGLISGVSQFSACFIYAFASTSFLIYLAGAADFLNGSMVAIGKSILSKTVEQDEMGSIVACIGILDTISPLIAVPIYSQFYAFTLSQLPGAFYLLSALLSIPSLIIFATLVVSGLLSYGPSSLRTKDNHNVLDPEKEDLLKVDIKIDHGTKSAEKNEKNLSSLSYGSLQT